LSVSDVDTFVDRELGTDWVSAKVFIAEAESEPHIVDDIEEDGAAVAVGNADWEEDGEIVFDAEVVDDVVNEGD
jgi:hypothetical protein